MVNKTFLNLNQIIRYNINQIIAVTEKDIKLNLRFKFQLIVNFINPIITILMPLIIFQTLFNFSFNESFGPWNIDNYAVFILSTYNLSLLTTVISGFPNQLRREKFWKTLPALIIAPFNRIDLLLGIFLTNLILISIPFILFLIITLIIYPISILTLVFILFIYLLIALIFSGIGLFLGVFAISKENLWNVLSFLLQLIFWASCIAYPFDLFPEELQNIIMFNPLYYIFTLLRMAWIDNNILLTIMNYYPHIIIILITSILLPIVSILIFNNVYRKYGIVGY
jgi:ABC-type polysaccharide/polyol phosphate export permease